MKFKKLLNKVTFIDPDTGKIHFDRLKYDLDDLFENTPVFGAPEILLEKQNRPWSRIANAILSPFNKIYKYIDYLVSLKF